MLMVRIITRFIINKRTIKTNKNKNKTIYKYKYLEEDGENLKDKDIFNYISSISIPPAYEIVYINPNPKAIYSCIGIDSRGKKQYKFSNYYNEIRGIMKFCHLIDFGRNLPNIRRKYNTYLDCYNSNKISKIKLISLIVKIIDLCNFRIGGDRDNITDGIITLKPSHFNILNREVIINFLGKHSKKNLCSINDDDTMNCIKQIVNNVENNRNIFSYYNNNNKRISNITPKDVNFFFKDFGKKITTKNFRTWAANKILLEELSKLPYEISIHNRKKNINLAIKKVSEKLHHSPTICKKEYIIPTLINLYIDDKPIFFEEENLYNLDRYENMLLNFMTTYYKKYECSKIIDYK